MKFRLSLFAFLILAIATITAVTSAQRKPEADKPITGDFKITIKQTVAGQTMQSTTLIKGQRERTETSYGSGAYSMNTINITQCDMKRTIQINDRARKYLITPMDDDSSTAGTPAAAPRTSGPSTRGGVVTMTVNTIDTGERKEIMGFTARHLKRTTIMESSPDACSEQKMKFETDGWYINLEYGLSCPSNQASRPAATAGGCRDRYVFKRTGPTHLGYPLLETTTMYGPDGSVSTTITKEVIEISRQPQDVALFDIPAGYTEAKSQEEMYATPSAAELMAVAQQPNEAESPTVTQPSTAAARVRVGVVQFNNKTKTQAATDSLQQQLVAALTSHGIDAVALNAISPSEAVAEAQAKQVSYILYTDIATLKAPSAGKKIGGMFGRATGIGSADSGKAEAKLDYRLVPTGSTSPAAQSSISAKEETADVTLSAAIRDEARAVAGAIPRP